MAILTEKIYLFLSTIYIFKKHIQFNSYCYKHDSFCTFTRSSSLLLFNIYKILCFHLIFVFEDFWAGNGRYSNFLFLLFGVMSPMGRGENGMGIEVEVWKDALGGTGPVGCCWRT